MMMVVVEMMVLEMMMVMMIMEGGYLLLHLSLQWLSWLPTLLKIKVK